MKEKAGYEKMILLKWLKGLSASRVIALSFLIVILAGAALLCLPLSSRTGDWTDPLSALFTATSATCVTGLIVADTYTHWSVFGQIVILGMIQIGGIGLMTVITMIFIYARKRIGLNERMVLMQAEGNLQVSGIVRLIRHIIFITLIIEGIGAVLLATRFCPEFGPVKGIYYSVFHSISAFCNAGFDLMGCKEAFSSLTLYETDWIVSLTISGLIVAGGIGFVVWDDIIKHKWHFDRYYLHSKIVLCMTLILITVGWIGFFIFEYSGNLSNLSMPEKFISALFMSVTTRTAGFNTMDLSTLSDSGCILSMILMLIGGNPGSTAGGIKTSTIAIIFIAIACMTQGYSDVTVFKKRLEDGLVKQAAVILVVYLTGVLFAAMIICGLESAQITDVMFEVVSAAGTVGLSRSLTPSLGSVSKVILIGLMFFGRIGGFSMILVLRERKIKQQMRRPSEKIIIG